MAIDIPFIGILLSLSGLFLSRLARALKNTGMEIRNSNSNGEPQEIGYPKLIQVKKAWDYLVKFNEHKDLDIKIKVILFS